MSMKADSSIQPRKPRRQRSRGQALVEFALAVPLFLGLLFAILDFGFMLYSRITLINATREGARAAVTQVDNPQGIPAIVKSTIQANATALSFAPVVVVTTCVAQSGSCAFSGGTDPIPGDSIQVSTTYAYHSFFARFFGANVTLGSTVRMVLE